MMKLYGKYLAALLCFAVFAFSTLIFLRFKKEENFQRLYQDRKFIGEAVGYGEVKLIETEGGISRHDIQEPYSFRISHDGDAYYIFDLNGQARLHHKIFVGFNTLINGIEIDRLSYFDFIKALDKPDQYLYSVFTDDLSQRQIIIRHDRIIQYDPFLDSDYSCFGGAAAVFLDIQNEDNVYFGNFSKPFGSDMDGGYVPSFYPPLQGVICNHIGRVENLETILFSGKE